MADGILKVGTITTSSGSGNITIGSGVTLQSNVPAFFALKTSNQNVTDETQTKVTFDSEVYDIGSGFDLSNDKFVVPTNEGGKYIFYGGVDSSANANQQLDAALVYVYKNGSIIGQYTADSSSNPISQFTCLWTDSFVLSATDYIEVYAYIDDTSGTPTVIGNSTIHKTFFGGYKLGA